MVRSRCFCCCLPGCLVLAAIPLIIGAYLLRAASERPSDMPEAKTYTPAQVHHARARIRDIEAKAQHARRASEKGIREPFRLELSEDDLNAYVLNDPKAAERLKTEGFRDVHVSLGDGVVGFQGGVPFANRTLWIRADGTLRPGDDGNVYFDPEKVTFGRLRWQLPSSVQARFTGEMKRKSEKAIFRVPGRIESIKVVPGRIVIRGVAEPGAREDAAGTKG